MKNTRTCSIGIPQVQLYGHNQLVAIALLICPLFKFASLKPMLTPFDIAGFCSTTCAVYFERARKFIRVTLDTGGHPYSES